MTKRFGRTAALDHFSADVAAGSCTALMGPNGAGKSTLNRLVYGRIRRDGGELSVLGRDPSGHAGYLKSRIGVVTQDNYLDAELTVLDNLAVFGIYHGMPGRQAKRRAHECLELFGLQDRAGESISTLSGGMQRRLALARALVHSPDLVLLDEPTTGLDPVARESLWATLHELRRSGKTLLLATHYLEEAERLADEVIIINRGRQLDSGSPRDLIHRHLGTGVARAADTVTAPASLDDLYLALFGQRDAE
ncbi:ABC transporter ATP-binding protein [Catenuloplanes sp. NPDC051500]|uniref:ABC transporter ATP-binding protein n=1 Tax=Catenuloplanes sp. NPDC051500 TaxID=3363959 RepID=UPI0037AF3386